MSDREARIEVIAIMKSLIESGMNIPDEEFEITVKQHLDVLNRMASYAAPKENRVFNKPTNESNTGGAYTVFEVDDKGKYVRLGLDDAAGQRHWVSAWDKDADACRGASPGDGIDCDMKASGKYMNIKNVKVHSNIPF
tara:strand:+ start:688 stop:1101 length:414 start_codon:yes stop_codon:yes gene_type:complete